MKILVIEDHSTQLKLAYLVLRAAGHVVSGASAAEQAFDSIKADRPQLILLDLGLPDMDGLELVRRLRADPETCDLQIVAVTSFPERYPRAAALAAGCNAYILKPIDTRGISGQLAAVLAASDARAQAPAP
ncbi:MAG: response regulator [Steroidobacteraceae bacterium]